MKQKELAKKSNMSEEQLQEIREAFDLFDTDGSGVHSRNFTHRSPRLPRLALHALRRITATAALRIFE